MLALRDISIDAEFKALIPPLSDEERTQLMVNIQRDGFRDPLVVWMNHAVLLDGHNRYELWRDVFADDGKIDEPSIVEMRFATRDDAKLWMIRNQLGRRNLLPAVRVQLALQLKPVLEAKAKENQKKAGGAVLLKLAEPVKVRDEIAKSAGVSGETVRKVETVLRDGDDATKRSMLSGEKKINAAFRETKQRLSEPDKTPPPTITPAMLIDEFRRSISIGASKLKEKFETHGFEYDISKIRKMIITYIEGMQ